uniref:Lactase n=1 Tax=Stegastes partitus TaxID=144197 RepID=A0A3B5AHL3_9TELE
QIRDKSLFVFEYRLPEFTPEEVQRINGTHDFFGLNHYCSVLAFHIDVGDAQDYDSDRAAAVMADRTWLETGSNWLRITPFGFRKLLEFIKDEYGNPPIYVTENGVSEKGAVDLNDVPRQYYYENYINQGLKARVLDGADLRGYTAWSLMDNFEWAEGYAERFGLFFVNRSDPNLPRIPKVSASHYTSIIKCNGFKDPALGPHECLTPDDGVTPTPGDRLARVAFLGRQLSADDAEVSLYVLFGFLLVSLIGIITIAYGLLKTIKKLKKASKESFKMARM